VGHFAAEVTEDLTHADSRLWRTLLALIFQPGLLTREFLDGRRVRYLPPLRLYLVLSLVFFLVVLAAPIHIRILTPGDKAAKQDCHLYYQGPFAPKVTQALEKACRELGSGRDDALGELVVHSLSRAMFVFLPVLALVMVPLYRRPRRFYVEHLLLFIHNHAFVFLFGTLGLLIGRLVPDGLPSILLALAWVGCVPWYVYRSMRRVYGQGRWLTISKLAVVGVAYVICAEIMVLMTALYSVLAV